jgi:hypothetical protein
VNPTPIRPPANKCAEKPPTVHGVELIDTFKGLNATLSGRINPYRLNFAFVNILTITDSEDKDINIQQGIDHPVITDAVLAKAGKLTLKYRIGFRLLDQFLLNEIEDSFRLGLR